VTFHQTRWSDEESGRVYRHDVRALQSYKADAQKSLVQWRDWDKVKCPVLVIHGMLSDALLEPTLKRMQLKKSVSVMHVPDTGHTPVLSDRNQNWFIRQWLTGRTESREWTVLHARLRDDPVEPAKSPAKVAVAAE
jgi:pimeloyl-ACP methyl ester carboxylesterase